MYYFHNKKRGHFQDILAFISFKNKRYNQGTYENACAKTFIEPHHKEQKPKQFKYQINNLPAMKK